MTNNGGLMRRYLLGTATEAERIAVENDYLANGEAFHQLKATENDLIDSYARGELAIAEKEAFEKRYLTSPPVSTRTSAQGRSRVKFASVLREITKEAALSPSPKEAGILEKLLAMFRAASVSPKWRLAAACAIVLVGGLISLKVLSHRGGGPSEASRHPDRQQSNHPGPAEHANEPGAGTESGTPQIVARNDEPAAHDFTAQLEPDAARAVGSGLQTLAAPSHTAWLNLGVVVDEDEARPLAAVVETPEGNQVFRTDRGELTTSQRGRVLHVRVPAARIPAGDYILEVKANDETVASCSFRLAYK